MTYQQTLEPFLPPFWMRAPLVQTLLASQKFRRRGKNAMIDAARDLIFDLSEGVRLKGAYSPHPESRGLIVFLHGWEGSQDSTYVVSCGRYLYQAGYSVFRLNFRDHGDTHALNEGIFYGGLLEEVFEAVSKACALEPDLPAALIGFSLGGNFALRIARESAARPIPNLSNIFAISPPVDTYAAAQVPDAHKAIGRYFYKKWTTSLRKKQAIFPHLYDFSEAFTQTTIMGLSQALITRYTPFDDLKSFFGSYAIGASDLCQSPAALHIIHCQHDPVVPAGPLRGLALPPSANLIILEHGGHNGFFSTLFGPTWYDCYIEKTLAGFVSKSG